VYVLVVEETGAVVALMTTSSHRLSSRRPSGSRTGVNWCGWIDWLSLPTDSPAGISIHNATIGG